MQKAAKLSAAEQVGFLLKNLDFLLRNLDLYIFLYNLAGDRCAGGVRRRSVFVEETASGAAWQCGGDAEQDLAEGYDW